MKLPLTPEEVTAGWLTEAFASNHPGVEVTEAITEAPVWGTATKLRVQLRYNAAGEAAGLPPSVIVKAGFAEHRELMSHIYAKEVRFYRDLLPDLPINAPRCLFAADDAEHKQHLIILEDLDRRQARFCRVQKPLNYAQTAAFLDVIARYTARWWNSPNLADMSLWHWDPLPPGDEGVYQWGQLKPEVWKHYMQLPRGAAVPTSLHDRDRMERALLKLQAFDREGPMCFLHGDFHLGNLYHDADGTPGVLDWQSYCTGPWSHDVTYFMVSALDIADRRKWDRALLGYYLERLAAYGATPPDFDTAWGAYRRQIVNGLYFWLVNPVEWQSEVNNCSVAPRFAAAAIDHDTFELMG